MLKFFLVAAITICVLSPAVADSTSSSDESCLSGLSEFSGAYDSWSSAFNRYINATRKTSSSYQGVANSQSYADSSSYRIAMSVASGFAEYEIKAINSAINAEEPKLQAAQSILDRSRSLQTARQTNDILLLVHRIGQDALVWSNQRYALLSNVASGGNGFSMDQSAQNDIRYAQSSLEQNWSNLKYSKQCQGF